MRAAAIALMVVLGGIAVPAAVQAAPSVPHDAIATGNSPNVIQVAGGCGPGWHSVRYRDRWGYWHRRCVRNSY